MKSQVRKYLKDTRRPIYSAALLLPFFLIYHIGTVFLKTTYVNGADAMIARLLSALTVHSVFASALVLLACFVIWQIRTQASWKIDGTKLFALFAESLLFAFVLFAAFGWLSIHLSRPGPRSSLSSFEKLILYCGAGIYEELLFRGFLLGILILAFTRLIGMKKTPGTVLAAVAASLLFALFHYLGTASDSFTVGSFLQRTLGGLYFSILFVTRGFGVTAASHALYDILVGLTAL
jgi:membrane protease YdiL (CAAX protease family)